MKISRMIIATALLTLPMFATAQPTCSATDVHCVTFAGAEGKFVKVIATIGGQSDSFVECFSPASANGVPEHAVASGFLHVGDSVKAEFRQCKTDSCDQNIPLSTDTFTITKTGTGYSSDPSTYTVQLDDTYGTSCTPTFTKSSMVRYHGN